VTRKDYERIAKAVRESWECEKDNYERTVGVSRVAHTLAFSLANENPRFNTEKFLTACGFPSLVK
jgi:hypothetical protein